LGGLSWSHLAPCLLGGALLLAGLFALTSLGRKSLPGRLAPKGSFNHEDPANKEAIAERKRDFARIVATKRDIWIFTDSSRSPGAVLPVELPSSGSSDTEDTAKISYQKLKFWLQGELGKIPGAVDLGLTSQWPVVDRLVYFISATPGFDFVMQHKVPPMHLQAKYVIMISKTGQVRAAWYAFVTDKVTPGATAGPFVVKLVSEDLNAERGGRTYSEFTYTANATRETDMEKVIAKHLPVIVKGIETDNWGPFLQA